MDIELTGIIANIEELSTSINSNVFIESARASFSDGIEEYEISDEEKAKLIAQYEANVSVGVITQIINLAKELPEIQARTELLKKQTSSQEAQTKKILHEIEEIRARTLKNYGFRVTADNNGVLLTEDTKSGMIDKQIISEMWRHRDMKAGVTIKNKSIYTTLQNAKFEEARTHIAIKANADNLYLKKADYKVSQLNAMAIDDDYILTAEQISDVKNTIDAIPTTPPQYNTTVEMTFTEVDTNDIVL